MQQDSDLLSVSGAAKILDRPEQTVRDWERRGHLTARRLSNGTRVFMRKQVEQLAERLRGTKGEKTIT